ncbi:MAG: indole-3-glycerol phosphate synthase TrpC [Candidatus Omnitrophota bacterium]
MNILDEILAYKKEQLKKLKKTVPFLNFIKALDSQSPNPRFEAKLRETGVHLIAEVKKASPSAGVIREDFDAKRVAAAYEKGCADCLSVLTEDRFFKGSISYLNAIASMSALPLLRKDFIIDEYQIYESKCHGADAVLLIAAILKDNDLNELLKAASDVGLDALVEVHTPDELKRALDSNAAIIGINSRDLQTLKIDLSVLKELLPSIPSEKLVVCESGIKSVGDLDFVRKFRVNAVLVGEALMRAKDIASATHEFVDYLKRS